LKVVHRREVFDFIAVNKRVADGQIIVVYGTKRVDERAVAAGFW
jgi:hypothetical protein